MKPALSKAISEREDELKDLTIGKMIKAAAEDKNIISLGPGEPDFTPSRHVIKAACDALKGGFTHYSPVEGKKDLREEIARKLKGENKISVSPDQVVVTCGSNEAIMLSLMACVDPGEQVLVPDPGFLSYISSIDALNGNAISISASHENGFLIDIEKIKSALANPKKVRAIIINTPNNPTGAVYSKKNLEEIAEIAIERDLMVISDEAYEKFIFKEKHVSFGSLNGMDKYTVTLQSFSKTYGMAGFRLGYAAGPEKLIKAMSKLHIITSICAPTVSQMAGIAALKGPQSDIKKHVKEFDKRRKFLLKRLNEIPILEPNDPEGAFYAFPKLPSGISSLRFAERLMKEAKVIVMPGSEFGSCGEGFIRISYATTLPKIEIALNRMEKFCRTLKF